MFRKTKKLLTSVLILGLMSVGVSNVSMSAATIGQNSTNSAVVKSVNTASSRIALSISNSGTANISAGVVGKIGTSKIKMTITLQKYNSSSKSWKKVKSWDKTYNSVNASFSTSYKVESKGTYRCKFSASV